MNEQVIDKIKGLLSLSQSSNLHESSVAWATAQKLMLKYRISEVELNSSAPKEAINTSPIPLFSGQRSITWMSILAGGIAKVNSCGVVVRSTNDGVIFALSGRPSDQEIVRYFYNSIVSQIEILSARAMKERNGPKSGAKTFSNNFKLGAVETVLNRLDKIKEEVKQEANQEAKVGGTSAAMVLASRDREIEQYMAKEYPKLVYVSKPHRSNENAKDLGRAAGNSVNINPGLGTKKPSRLLS